MFFRDCRQITFITLNRFCPLSKKNHPPLLNGQYQDGWNTNQNQMKNTLFLHCISSFGGTSSKNCSHWIFNFLFFFYILAFTSADIIFSQIFKTSFNIIWKKKFRHKFSFFNGFNHPPPPNPLNGQNLLNLIKVFCHPSLKFF